MHNRSSTTSRRARSTAVVAVGAAAVVLSASVLAAAERVDRRANPSGDTARAGALVISGFENGIGPWKRLNGQTSLSRVQGGHGGSSHSAQIRAPRSSRATIGMTDQPALVSSTTGGRVYTAHAWLKAGEKALKRGAVTAKLITTERSAGGVEARSWREVRLTGNQWRQVSVPITARGGSHQLDLTIVADRVLAGGAIRIDNVSVEATAAPSVTNAQVQGPLFGASVDDPNGNWVESLKTADARFSRLDVVRVFEPDLPGDWDGRLGEIKRPFAYSFRARPAAVLAGIYDRDFLRWFRQAPTSWPIWWTYFHEPEDDIARGEFTAAKYRAAWQHIYEISADVDNSNLRPTLNLMCWTLSPGSGRTFSDYYPGNFIKVLSWDCYNTSSEATAYKPAGEIFDLAVQKSKALGKGFAISEFGSRLLPGDDGSRRAEWLASVARYAASKDAVFVTYWDAVIPAGNFKLRDVPSVRLWSKVVDAN